jgi:hypothetical protein
MGGLDAFGAAIITWRESSSMSPSADPPNPWGRGAPDSWASRSRSLTVGRRAVGVLVEVMAEWFGRITLPPQSSPRRGRNDSRKTKILDR